MLKFCKDINCGCKMEGKSTGETMCIPLSFTIRDISKPICKRYR